VVIKIIITIIIIHTQTTQRKDRPSKCTENSITGYKLHDTYKSKNEGKTVSKGAIHSVAASYFTLYPPVRLKEVLKRRPVNHEVLKREVDKPHRVGAVISHLKPKVARIF